MKTILVPLDGSPFGEQALPVACDIARRAGAALHLIHVYVPVSPEGLPVTHPVLQAQGRQRDRAYLASLCDRLKSSDANITVTYAALDGAWVRTILEYASAVCADLIVMTTHGRSGFSRMWLGSVATGLVHASSIPILLLHVAQEERLSCTLPFHHILIPLDGSPRSEQILPHAQTLGRLMGATCTLVSVLSPTLGTSEDLLSAGLLDESVAVQQRAQCLLERMQALANNFRQQGINVETQVLYAERPAKAILEIAGTSGADLIAMATHGRGGVGRLLFGSIADTVVRNTRIPVLLYRPHGLETP